MKNNVKIVKFYLSATKTRQNILLIIRILTHAEKKGVWGKKKLKKTLKLSNTDKRKIGT